MFVEPIKIRISFKTTIDVLAVLSEQKFQKLVVRIRQLRRDKEFEVLRMLSSFFVIQLLFRSTRPGLAEIQDHAQGNEIRRNCPAQLN